MSDLKPCPFCGARGYNDTSYEGHTYCDKCDAATVNDNWNTRPIEDALHARTVEAERLLSGAIKAMRLATVLAREDMPKSALRCIEDALREIGGE